MNGETIATIVIAVFASGGLWTFLTELIKNRKKKLSPADKMTLALGRDKLLFLNKKYRKLSFIPEDEWETYEGLYTAYVELGGNSKVRKGFEDNKSLPIKED